MGRFLSVYEKSMPDVLSLEEKLQLVAEAGYDGMEISIDETETRLNRLLSGDVRKKTLSGLKSSGVPVKTMCLSGQRKYPFGSRSAEIREKSLRIVKSAIDFSCEAGIRVIQIPGYDVWYEKSGEDTAGFFYNGLSEAVEYASGNGVILAFETMENAFMNTVGKAMKYVDEISSPYLQIYPDLGNIRNGTDKYIEDLHSGKGHIAAVHLKDTREGVFRDLELGEGRVDFVGCIRELLNQKVGIFNCEIRYDKKSTPLEFIRRNKKTVDFCFAQSVRRQQNERISSWN